MAKKNERPVPARAIHPGEVLREELQERGIKQKEFAQQISVQASHLNAFIKGKRNLNEELAIKLEEHLGIPYNIWMSLHNGYLYDCKAIKEKQEKEQEAISYETELSEILNLKILYKRLDLHNKPCLIRVTTLKELFNFDLLSANELRHHVGGFYKHSEKVIIDDKNMLTWLVLNSLATSKSLCPHEYVKGNALRAANEIAKMANSQIMTIQSIKDCLNGYGISYIEVEKIEKAPIDAFSTISNGHPCITVTYRYNDMDKLAFHILHELYHVENHLSEENKAFISIENEGYSTNPLEKDADLFARRMLIPDEVWNNLLKVKCGSLSPITIIKAIAKEAVRYGISPSIAISRYKHDTGWYKTSAYQSPKIFNNSKKDNSKY